MKKDKMCTSCSKKQKNFKLKKKGFMTRNPCIDLQIKYGKWANQKLHKIQFAYKQQFI